MKAKNLLILCLIFFVNFSSIFAQGFRPPAAGKAVVYFVREKKHARSGISFEYFHNDKYIGKSKGKEYFRYECDLGEQLLWVSCENKEFLSCNLEAGKTYIVFVKALSGFGKARVLLIPITTKNSEYFNEVKSIVMAKQPVEIKEKDILEMNDRLQEFIATKLEQYENMWKGGEHDQPITPEMAISEEAIK